MNKFLERNISKIDIYFKTNLFVGLYVIYVINIGDINIQFRPPFKDNFSKTKKVLFKKIKKDVNF